MNTLLLLTYFGSTIVFLAIVSYSIVLLTMVFGATSIVTLSFVLNSWAEEVSTITSYRSTVPRYCLLVVLKLWSSLFGKRFLLALVTALIVVMYNEVVALATWVVVIPIKLLLFLTAYTAWPSTSEKELPSPTELETINADPIPLLYINFCPVNNPWLGIEIAFPPLLPSWPICGGRSWSLRIVPSLDTTFTTWVVPKPTDSDTDCVTNTVPIPIVLCGLKTSSLFFWILKLVFIPIGNVNLLWSIETSSPSEKYVLIPLSLKIL